MLKFVIFFFLLANVANAQLAVLNQCRDTGSPCPTVSVDTVQGAIFDETEEFVTHLDYRGPSPITRCFWDWQVSYDPAIIDPNGFSVNYTPLLETIVCNVTTAPAPPGFPGNTGRVTCSSTDTNLNDAFPNVFAASFADITLRWAVLPGLPPGDNESTIVAGNARQGFKLGSVCSVTSNVPMNTDLEFIAVPEPSVPAMLAVAVIFFCLLHSVRILSGKAAVAVLMLGGLVLLMVAVRVARSEETLVVEGELPQVVIIDPERCLHVPEDEVVACMLNAIAELEEAQDGD